MRMLSQVAAESEKVITIEDGCLMGGLYGAVAEVLSSYENPLPVKAIGIPDRYIAQGTQEELKEECGLTFDRFYAIFCEECEKMRKKDEKVLEN